MRGSRLDGIAPGLLEKNTLFLSPKKGMCGSQKHMADSANLMEVFRDTKIVIVTNYSNLKAVRAHLYRLLP